MLDDRTDQFGDVQVHMETGMVDKVKDLFTSKSYSMYENKICHDYQEGKVTKEKLDKCSTCDMYDKVNNRLRNED